MHSYRNEPFGFRGPRGSYYGRGNVKFAILALLKEQPRHGYDIIRVMEDRSGGVYSPSPGVIYPTLQALEDQDYVKSAEQDGKKVYSITEAGGAYLQGHQEKQGHSRHGEGFRPPFPPPFPFGPGPRGFRAENGESAGPADTAASGPAGTDGAEPGAQQAESAGGDTGEAGSGRGGRRGHGPRGAHGPGGAWGPWFASSGGPEMMREMRWLFSDFASAIQRTIGDPDKLREIREVLREAKTKVDDIVMR
jgi:hypothetical protein